MRIKYIIPFPFDAKGIARRAAQIPHAALGPSTEVECVPVRNGGTSGVGYYEAMIFDTYVTEAGLRSEEEGYDAVVMDTITDSGLYALRSRLSIPVIGPAIVSFTVAAMLGKKFSIITMWDQWRYIYEKNLETYRLWEKCASIRAVGVTPDTEALFEGKEEEMFTKITAEAQKAVDEDGADCIILGSTTMHQAGAYLSEHLDALVINPGPVALKITEALVELGLTHSKVAFPSSPTIHDEKLFSLMSAGDPVAISPPAGAPPPRRS